MKTIVVDDELYAYIAGKTREIGESAADILRRELSAPATSGQTLNESRNSVPSHELLEVLTSRKFSLATTTVDKFLMILGEAFKQRHADFGNVLDIRGRDRYYFAESSVEIEDRGRSTQPRKIPGTEYWVMTNSPTNQKAAMLYNALKVIGFSEDACKAAKVALYR